jgi:hypothetical protein
MTLDDLLQQNGVTLDQVQKHLAALDGAERVRQSTSLGRSRLAVLWQLAGTKPDPIALEELVPSDAKPLEPFPFEGQNSLLAFRMFKKVFYRTPDGKIAGYNDQAMGWLTGPGYYIVEDAKPDIFIDYTQIPTVKPAGWPEIKKNESGLSTLVYGHMQDYLRRVYGKVLIGRAIKKGNETENYFVLARPEMPVAVAK